MLLFSSRYLLFSSELPRNLQTSSHSIAINQNHNFEDTSLSQFIFECHIICMPIRLIINRPFCAASSTAVLVELTPLLGALLGVVVTLVLVAVCIVIFVKVRGKVNCAKSFSMLSMFYTVCALSLSVRFTQRSGSGTGGSNTATEPDKGSAEPLSRNMGSHSSIGI